MQRYLRFHCGELGNWQNKPKRRQTETSTDRNVDKPKHRRNVVAQPNLYFNGGI